MALYCVSSMIRRMSLLRQFESVKSMMRYAPPNGTAGLARSRVSGSSREPFPPARMTVSTPRMAESVRSGRAAARAAGEFVVHPGVGGGHPFHREPLKGAGFPRRPELVGGGRIGQQAVRPGRDLCLVAHGDEE